ncbi:glycoside hydrolase family 127 protein [Plantactinospora solaniradicis]|uniref:Glycoside hydrolase family 127 protein n=1 Tax=Plantactinospora solaniradicis TaxID=1723736 RepID=A0ABW1K5Z1_9ACTN
MLHPEVHPDPTVAYRVAARSGPAQPTPDAVATLHPLGLDDVRLDPAGLLGQWQARNAAATLPHCVAQLREGGALDNLRRLRGDGDVGAFTGMWFSDSDVYKTLEAAAWELARPQPGTELRDFLESTVALLAQVQDADGYLNSYVMTERPDRRWQELHWSHELYCAGHLFQAAVATARVGLGDLLETVARRLADLLLDRFGPDGVEAVCGHPEVETALVELYRTTGHRPYLDLARRFVDLRGRGLLNAERFGPVYLQDHVPVRDAEEVAGHAVRQLYLLAGVVDVAVETGDASLLAAARRLWDSAYLTKTYVTGAHGSRHRDEAYGDPYELPPDRAYAETCAAVASFQWNWRMLLADGAHRYADEMERVLYNAVAGSTALDGTHFFYSNPLQLRTGHDGSDEDAPGQRMPWYACACCPPNLARLMASVQAYTATGDAEGLQLHLYAAGTLHATVHGRAVRITVRTGYPWSGRVEVTVRAESTEPWTLALRVPGWCQDYRIEADGADVTVGDGYLRLTRDWSSSTPVTLELAMPPRLVAAHPYVDAVRGCLALMRGPLVYCLEQADLPPGTRLEDVRLDPASPMGTTALPGGPPDAVALTVGGTVARPGPAGLYRAGATSPDGPSDQVTLSAVPYFLWGNRDPGPMRVWIPVDTATAPTGGRPHPGGPGSTGGPAPIG